MLSICTQGVDDLAVDLRGSGRFKPQSPRARPDSVVSIEACVGKGNVALSDVEFGARPSSDTGLANGGGNENSRELFSKEAVGESLRADIWIKLKALFRRSRN